MRSLAGKSIVIIGGTTGLGLSAGQACVEAGAQVVLVGRNPESAAAAAETLGSSATTLVGDAREPDTAVRAIELAQDRWGAFSGLYHVAGGSGRRYGDGPLHELTDEGWEETLRLNLTSVFYSNRAAVRAFQALGQPGSVVNCGSVLGFSPAASFFATHAYAAAKSALTGFAKSCAASYAKEGIRFNVLAPALVATPMSRRAQDDDRILAYARSKQPLARNGIADASDVDGLVVFLLSDAARGMTGQVVSVDWGWGVSEGRTETWPDTECET